MLALVDLIHITSASWLPAPAIETFWGIPWQQLMFRRAMSGDPPWLEDSALGFNIESTSEKQTEIAAGDLRDGTTAPG